MYLKPYPESDVWSKTGNTSRLKPISALLEADAIIF